VASILDADDIEQVSPYMQRPPPDHVPADKELVTALRTHPYVLVHRQSSMELRGVAKQTPCSLQRVSPALLLPDLDTFPVGWTTSDPHVIHVNIHECSIGTDASDHVQPVLGMFMGLGMYKDSNVREVIIMIDDVLQIDTTLRPSIVLEEVWQG